jgi:hypothetical protein
VKKENLNFFRVFEPKVAKFRSLPVAKSASDLGYIFAEKFSEKIGVFVSKQSQIMKKVDHNIGF